MIEVLINGQNWRRKAKEDWAVFHPEAGLHSHWQSLTDEEAIALLEVGFQYGRAYLRWQVSQLRSD